MTTIRSPRTARSSSPWLPTLCVAVLAACSSAPEGGNGAGTSSGGSSSGGTSSGATSSSGGCQGAFCLEEQRHIGTDPVKLVFPDIDPSADAYELTLRVKHDGTAGTLQVTGFKFVPDNGDFKIPEFTALSLSPGEVAPLKVSYKATKLGAQKIVLVLISNDIDADDREYEVPVEVKAGSGALKVDPDPIDFGPVATGKCGDKSVKLFNTGTKPLTLTSVQLSATGSPDFTIKTPPDLSAAIEPNASASLVLTFCPKPGEDNDTSELLVETDDGKLTVTDVYGGEIIAKISVIPGSLDFGSMQVGATASKQFKIFSEGLADLEVTKIELSPLSTLKTVTIDLPGPHTLKPSDSQIIKVDLTASMALANNGSAVAALVLHTNDPVHKLVNVPLFAKTESGKLQISPPDNVDFAIAAKGVSVERKVTLSNVGTSAIKVSKVELVEDSNGEFTLDPKGYGPAMANPTEQELIVSKPQELLFTFKPATTSGLATGKFIVHSDDPDKKAWTVTLSGTRAEGATCAIQVIPAVVNMGLISFGKSTTAKVQLRNIGTGYCEFSQAVIRPCPAGGFGPLQLPPTCALIGSTEFSTFAPSTKLFHLGPGEIGTMPVKFDAPNDAGFFADPKAIQSYYGYIAFEFTDPVTGDKKWYPKDPTDKPNISKYTPNILAKVGQSGVAVLPDSVDFGLVTVGCKSNVKYIRIYNTGNIPAYVTHVELQGCGLEVAKYKWPGIPKSGLEVTTSGPQELGLQYAPQNVGKDECQAVITTGVEGKCVDAIGNQVGGDCKVTADCTQGVLCKGQVFTVPLKGEGTLLDEYTDEFDLSAGKKVDVLFVIDNSGSMGDEQNNLATNFKSFVQIANLWQNNYHLGVTTTDMKSDVGRLREKSGLRILTNKSIPSAASTFPDLAKLGTNGSADEQGLEAAKRALDVPNKYDSCDSKCITCKTDKDCPDKMLCVADGEGVKACGGHNRGFLRKQAGLEVVFVSDEEDSSPAAVSFYVNFLKSIKGFANKGLMHAHAIVGTTQSSGSGGGGCGAQKGNRYLTVAKETGGKAASICDPSFAKTLQDIGNVAFGLSHQFFLTMNAQPNTIQVWVDGKACTGPDKAKTWYFDDQSNSVVLVDAADGGTCLPAKIDPAKGGKIKIYYKTLCHPKTP